MELKHSHKIKQANLTPHSTETFITWIQSKCMSFIQDFIPHLHSNNV